MCHVETEKLDPKEHREFRSCSGLCQFLTEQRFDIAFSTKEIMREAAGPTTASKTKLKKVASYLKGRRRCVLNFPWVGKLDDIIHVTVDADWAGDPKTRCSTSGGVLLHIRRSVGNRSVPHCSTLVCDTGNGIAIVSRNRGQGDHEGLH